MLTATALAGCVRYHAAALSPEANAAALESRTLREPRLREWMARVEGASAASRPVWGLTTLALAALYFHPDLDLARAQWATARGGVVTAGARPNPTVTGEVQHGPPVEGATTPWTIALSATVPIETFHKRGYRIEQATRLADAARLHVAAVAWQVRGRVRSALMDLWAAENRVALTRTEVQAREELALLLEQRLAVGEASRLDVTREEIGRDQARLALRAAERQAAQARTGIATAVGVPAAALSDVDVSTAEIASAAPPAAALAEPALRRAALLGRPDVLELVQQYLSNEAALRLEVARQYPDIQLGPGITWDQGRWIWALSTSFVLPLLDRNRGPILEAEGRRRETAARLTQLQASVIGQVDSALAGYRAASAGVATADSLLRAQRETAVGVEAQFRAGEADHVALSSARVEVATTELTRLDALIQQRDALGLLEDALQRPLFGEAALPVPEEQPLRGQGGRP